MTIALGIRVRRDALEVEIIEFSIDLKAGAKCLSFMSRIEVGIQGEWILEVSWRAHFSGPIIHRTIVFIVSGRCSDTYSISNVTMKDQSAAGLFEGPHILGLIVVHPKNRRERTWVGHEAIVLASEREGSNRPFIRERDINAALDVPDALLTCHDFQSTADFLCGWGFADVFHSAADIATPIQNALRALEHLDSLNIPKPR